MSTPTMDSVTAAAASLGLTMEWLHVGGTIRAIVSRDASDWSMAPQILAIGKVEDNVAARAMTQLQRLAPGLNKQLAAVAVEDPGLGIAAGVGSDGTVTALRVERDGTVRLHPDDIARIADAVAKRLRKPRVRIENSEPGINAIAVGTGRPDRGLR